MRYDALKYFVAPAIGTSELWRTGLGVALTFMAGLALYQLFFALLSNVIGPDLTRALIDATSFDTSSPAATLYILATFAFFALGLAMVTTTIHRRSPATLFGPLAAVASDALRVTLAVGALYLLLTILLPQSVELVRNDGLSRRSWIALLPISLTAIALQAGTEELVFRGYLQQQLAARFPDLPLWMVGPAALFALSHLSPATAGDNATLFALWAFAFGLAAADLTARTGSIGAAFGFHFANNVIAVLVTSLAGPGSGLALYHLPMAMDDPRIASTMLPEFATLLCGWLAARLALKV
ncbi:CPBP family intramembrane glutamic endopeptidase [Tropicimonas sp. IMCC6043]|uniref:CPBP family intramembrane glutamic endopeptidase n=1 Tax=Tropicimonas sp. IMCC6043 TaxID=2510645 RepID=UPI00101D0643|nr:type II CAAX endopeptidase family protein [Tropicimonas sp. IMCC6043]RYH10961.1 CPBP family intramembrane metalloprotease [Tropicimonas sp. IMCC6043]